MPTDDQGRMLPAELEARSPSRRARRSSAPRPARSTPARSTRSPTIVEPAAARRLVPRRRRVRTLGGRQPDAPRLLEGFERADSWATDGHKWLNVPYDCGIAAVADRRRAPGRDDVDLGLHPRPRRGRPLGPRLDAGVLAAGPWGAASMRRCARSGAPGSAELIDRCCDQAERMANRLGEADGVEVLNDVVLNQVLVRFDDDDDARTR